MDKLVLLTAILFGVLIVGALACLPLYKWNIRAFVKSTLFVKIAMWVPIYLLFLGVVLGGKGMAGAVCVAIAITAAVEYYRAVRTRPPSLHARLYLVTFYGALLVTVAGVVQLQSDYMIFMTMVFVSSVLSDVAAFFMGNYAGRHKLPRWINPRKNWEGVAGQIIGALAGAYLAGSVMGVDDILTIGLVVGVASAVGDILNSIAKRSLGIKDWGNTIPGHGGVLDRCSSLILAFAAMAVFALFESVLG